MKTHFCCIRTNNYSLPSVKSKMPSITDISREIQEFNVSFLALFLLLLRVDVLNFWSEHCAYVILGKDHFQMTQACSEMVMTYQFRCYRWGSLIIIGCCSVELVCYATLQIVDTGLSLIFEIIELFLEGTLMLLDKWKNMVVVHPGGTICAWMEQEYEGT